MIAIEHDDLGTHVPRLQFGHHGIELAEVVEIVAVHVGAAGKG